MEQLPRASIGSSEIPLLAASWPDRLGGGSFEPDLPVQWNQVDAGVFDLDVHTDLAPWAVIVQRFSSVGPDGAPNEMEANFLQCSEGPPAMAHSEHSCTYAKGEGGVRIRVDADDFPYVVVAVNWVDPDQQDLEIADAPTTSWGLQVLTQ
ncbi:hypothetical protein [Rhodococcus sp. SMB37]|uniref:hypothetical protein n=1 Tax=Rhodococcus sp. SMB37 TaxID=2512213 RepID=UPI001044661C|nr:hypothetical protein [Rhodococcus sp. SMB37]